MDRKQFVNVKNHLVLTYTNDLSNINEIIWIIIIKGGHISKA